MINLAGGKNVFQSFVGWKPVSLEAMLEANPDFIVMPQRGLKNAGGIEAVLAHPAIRMTAAGKKRQILDVDGMALLGFGPRTLSAAEALAQHFGTLGAGPKVTFNE